MNNSEVDQELVTRVKKGDIDAYDLLFSKYQQRVYNLVLRFVKDHGEAMDVTQEVFIKVWRALPKFRGDSAFYTWLYRIAVNTAKNHITTNSRRVETGAADIEEMEQKAVSAVLKDSSTPESILSGEQMYYTIENAIQNLPEELRVAISLREINGLSYVEIANVMDCPIGTVRSRIFRAREVIVAALDKLVKE